MNEHFRYCPRCAAPAASSGESKYFQCDACGFRLYFNVAVAVAIFLKDAEGRTLFLVRAKDPAKGKFGLPGGFVDKGESAEEAAHRETREEVGLAIRDLTFLCSAPNVYPYRGVTYPTTDVYFVGTAEGSEIAYQESEVTDSVWRDPFTVEYDDLAFPSLRAAMSVYRERFRAG